MARIAAIQMTSSNVVADNLKTVQRLVEESVQKGAELVALPENVAFIGQLDSDKLAFREVAGEGFIQSFLADLAAKHHIWIVGGTIPIATIDNQKVFASTWVWNDQGKMVARYDKIHLFDVEINEGENYFESRTIAFGKEVICMNSPVGKLGLTVCYDLRFPELYRALMVKGAEILIISSAFTVTTGEAHWESLLRARAIENQSYVLAPNQWGTHANGKKTFGHSMIIDPWGKILGCLKEGEGVIIADIDLDYLNEVRAKFPVLTHRVII